MGWFFDWGYLLVAAIILVGAFIWAGIATKNFALECFGFMLGLIMVLVFSTEAFTYFFTPQHTTISTSFGIFMSGHPIFGWLLLTAWVGFAWALAVHLASRKQVGDTK